MRLLSCYTRQFFDERIFDPDEKFFLAHEELPCYYVPDYEKDGKEK